MLKQNKKDKQQDGHRWLIYRLSMPVCRMPCGAGEAHRTD